MIERLMDLECPYGEPKYSELSEETSRLKALLYHNWSSNRITRALKDINALVVQEEEAATVRLSKEKHIPRVYRIRLNVLKDTSKKYKGGSFI